jgi:HEAT repeat protein
LADSDWKNRQLAVETLPRLGLTEASDALKSVAKNDPLANIRAIAISEYAKAPGVTPKPFLRTLLTDPNILVRVTAAYELAQMGDRSGYALAKRAIRYDAISVRMTAISVIAYAGNTQDFRLLRNIANDRTEPFPVRRSATQALEHMRLSELSQTEKYTYLRKALRDKSQVTRVWAAKELLRMNNAASKAILDEAATEMHGPGQREALSALKSIPN